MKKRYCTLILVVCICLMFIPSLASADLLKVDIDLTGYAGKDILLSFELWDEDGSDGSSVGIDNIVLDGILDFEGATPLADWSSLGSTLDSEVTVKTIGTNTAMFMDDSLGSAYPAFAEYYYTSIGGSTLSFDLNTSLTGLDYLAVGIYDYTGFPYADIYPALIIDATGVDTDYTSSLTTVVPVPGAVLLAGLGLGTSAFGILRNKRNVPSKSILLHSLKS